MLGGRGAGGWRPSVSMQNPAPRAYSPARTDRPSLPSVTPRSPLSSADWCGVHGGSNTHAHTRSGTGGCCCGACLRASPLRVLLWHSLQGQG